MGRVGGGGKTLIIIAHFIYIGDTQNRTPAGLGGGGSDGGVETPSLWHNCGDVARSERRGGAACPTFFAGAGVTRTGIPRRNIFHHFRPNWVKIFTELS